MNREIKFRGKRKYNCEWVEGDLETSLVPKGSMSKCPAICTTEGTIGSFFVCNDTVGQFTGLKDKNGKDIYEGDILMCIGQREDNKGRKYFRKVLFIDGTFGMRVPEYKCVSSLFNHVVDGKLNWEVVGNIYDNPELLEEKL
ncbi:hypothetical protein H6B28_12215 [Bacteroides mediterraneensis]|nr:hypothetical protein [Bacteroides mediterraneensis]